MQEGNIQTAKSILTRVKKVFKIKTDAQLAELLSIKPNTISSWKKRNTLDYESIIEQCNKANIDLNEIFLGNESFSFKKKITPIITKEMLFQYTTGELNLERSDIPTINIPFLQQKNSMVFQVNTSELEPSIKENTFVICEEATANDITNDSFAVIISKEKGLYMSKVAQNENDESILNLISRKESVFSGKNEIKKNKIDEIWKIKGVLDIFS
ncbi:helix-turn-helix domain-containing protein [Flavobacterium inviolabile]|uniref:helix-turn-helix domain-containing protein n=1 Tax=Flavobacterium inviolabile TaxID=2748320 RepID=UPI0015ADF2D8|nr:helix-turn-helix domain-containing protein [Flavobacterium inviolabile]